MKVFLSHTAEGKALADSIGRRLSHAGHHVSMAPSMFEPGQRWAPALAEAITSADAIVFVLDRDSKNSRWQSAEVALAFAEPHRRPIIPILASSDVEIPYYLRQFQALDLSHERDFTRGIETLLNAIESKQDNDTERSKDTRLHRDLLIAQKDALERARLEFEASRENWSRLLIVQILGLVPLLLFLVFEVIAVWRLAEARISASIVSTLSGLLAAFAGYYFGFHSRRISDKALKEPQRSEEAHR